MAEKDKAEKLLEDYNDVFADIVNVLLFGGERLIEPDDLEKLGTLSQYKADDGKLHEQERDVAKYWKKGGVRIALCGMENQTDIDRDMCFRIINYEGVSYRSQLLDKNSKERYPVLTMVLYFGACPWNGPKSLYKSMVVPEKIREYVNDYKINVFEIAYLTDEQVNMFTSDFRIVAEYFGQTRKNKEYKPTPQMINHVDELLKFMAVMTGDDTFVKAGADTEKGGSVTMCGVLEQIEKRGMAQGMAQGDARRLVCSVEGAMRLFKVSLDLACEAAGATVDEYEKAREMVKSDFVCDK